MQAFQKAIDASGGRYALAEFGIGYLVYLEGKPEEAATIIRRGWRWTLTRPKVT